MQIQPYLFFNGRCEEAIEFYRQALGAEMNAIMRYKDSPDPSMAPPHCADKVMHASFRVGDTTVLCSDGRCEGQTNFQGFALTLLPASVAEAERLFAALSEGGQVQMAMSETFFSPRFGMVADRFGMSWMIYVAPKG